VEGGGGGSEGGDGDGGYLFYYPVEQRWILQTQFPTTTATTVDRPRVEIPRQTTVGTPPQRRNRIDRAVDRQFLPLQDRHFLLRHDRRPQPGRVPRSREVGRERRIERGVPEEGASHSRVDYAVLLLRHLRTAAMGAVGRRRLDEPHVPPSDHTSEFFGDGEGTVRHHDYVDGFGRVEEVEDGGGGGGNGRCFRRQEQFSYPGRGRGRGGVDATGRYVDGNDPVRRIERRRIVSSAQRREDVAAAVCVVPPQVRSVVGSQQQTRRDGGGGETAPMRMDVEKSIPMEPPPRAYSGGSGWWVL